MPVVGCQNGGKPGFKWGKSGKCYTYTPNDSASRSRARSRAEAQGRAARAAGYRGKEDSCVNCQQPLTLVSTFDKNPKACCAETILGWRMVGEGQKIKCELCNNLIISKNIEKRSFIAEDYRNVCAYFLRKQVFATRADVDKWLSNNPHNRRWDYNEDELVTVDVVRETTTGWVVVLRPYEWFAMGTLKGQWTSIGIVVVTGNLLEDVDNRIPTDEEMQATAEFVERV